MHENTTVSVFNIITKINTSLPIPNLQIKQIKTIFTYFLLVVSFLGI